MEELFAPGAGASSSNLIAQLNLPGLISSAVVLALTWLAIGMVTNTLTGFGTRFVHRRLLLNQIATVSRFILWTVGVILAVQALNLPREFLLTMTGALAVMIGFAFKDLAASVLAGLTIIIDRPFQVGDRVSFGGFYGEIDSIGLRSVRLVTLDDNLVTIPNNKFLTEAVSSGNAGALDMLIQMDFYVGIDQDITLARQLVEHSILSNRYVYTRKPWAVMVNQVFQGESLAIRLRAKAYVLDVQYEKAYENDVTERVMDAFQKHQVLPPAVLHRGLSVRTQGAEARD